MREILFKGFHIDPNGKQIITLDGVDYRGEWKFGYYWTNEVGNHFIKVIRDENGDFVSDPTINDYEVLKETVCEYTGLTDKNGNRIWKNYKLKDGQGRVWLVLANKGGFILLSEKEYKDYLNNAPIVLFSGLSDMQTVGFVEQNCIVVGDIFNTRSVE